jgi:NAD(P)-dependent dehydrogenase (short-subunit alcohol dehydrogenase family)
MSQMVSEILQGKVAVVTGGSGVLGKEMVRTLVSAGAEVALLGSKQTSADAAAQELGLDVLALGCDVLEKASLEQANQDILERYGKIDILVNSAGGNRPEGTTSDERTFFDVDVDAVKYVSELNFLGTLQACQVFCKNMTERGEGVVINISSMASTLPLTRVLAYSAAKASVNNFTRWLAVHMAQTYSPSIRVNAIAPGFFLTEQNRYLLTQEDGSWTPRAEKIIANTPQQRLGEADEIASTLLWLTDPRSQFVTGTIIPVDGGFSAFGGV